MERRATITRQRAASPCLPRFTLWRLLVSLSFFCLTFACAAQFASRDFGIPWVLAGCWAFGAAVGSLQGRALRGGAWGLLGFVLGFALLLMFPTIY